MTGGDGAPDQQTKGDNMNILKLGEGHSRVTSFDGQVDVIGKFGSKGPEVLSWAHTMQELLQESADGFYSDEDKIRWEMNRDELLRELKA